jgi:hypothetical protein
MRIQPSNTNDLASLELTSGELDVISGGQQVFKHEFPGAVNQMTGLRSFEPTFAAAVADGTLPDPK